MSLPLHPIQQTKSSHSISFQIQIMSNNLMPLVFLLFTYSPTIQILLSIRYSSKKWRPRAYHLLKCWGRTQGHPRARPRRDCAWVSLSSSFRWILERTILSISGSAIPANGQKLPKWDTPRTRRILWSLIHGSRSSLVSAPTRKTSARKRRPHMRLRSLILALGSLASNLRQDSNGNQQRTPKHLKNMVSTSLLRNRSKITLSFT